MAWYTYWQQSGEDYWNLCLEEAIETILVTKKPAFTTVLHLDTSLEDEEISYEVFNKVRFKGSFYVDFDGEDIEVVIDEVKRFMGKLESKGVRLDELEYGLTGGRGFHILIPQKVFIQNPSSSGYQYLPLIYKEMAYRMVVDSLDMRVYSTKRGRMWRTYNVERSNGNYKVQATYAEMLVMTESLYEELCLKPRPCFDLPPPTYAPDFALEFSTSRDKVESNLKKRKDNQRDRKVMQQYVDGPPETILKIMSGEISDPEKGFHQIAMQLVLAVQAMGMSEQDFIDGSQGLCDKHESDGNRYNTPAKRRNELRRLYQYFFDNPCYEFSVGGIKSILEEDYEAYDLDYTEVPRGQDGDLTAEENNQDLFLGLLIRREGIWKETWNKELKEHVQNQVSGVGISNVHELIEHDTKESSGFEVSIHIDGVQLKERKKINNNDFDSKVNFRRALGGQSFINLPDAQIGALQEVLRAMATKSGNKVMTIPLEGINVLVRDKPINGTHFMTRYADRNGVWGYEHEGEDSVKFRLHGPFDPDGELKSDLMNAPKLVWSQEAEEYFDKFFGFFRPELTARVFGWYLAAFLTQHIRAYVRQFPILQCFGEAGGGKTSFNLLCANMHYYKRSPAMLSAGGVTPFAMEAPLASSGTIPVIFDEFKPREMQTQRANALLMLLRNNFNGTVGSKGKVNRDSGASHLGTANTTNSAPMVIMSEAKVTQEAVVHRSVLAAFPSKHTGGKESLEFQKVKNEAWRMGELGRIILDLSLQMPVEVIGKELEKIQEEVLINCGSAVPDRTLFSYSVLVLGLRLGKSALRVPFGDRYDERMEELIFTITGGLAEEEKETMSEVNRTINDLAYLSNRPSGDLFKLVEDEDYSIIEDKGEMCVDLHLRHCWDKYTRFVRSQGGELLFDKELSFVDAMYRHPDKVTTNFADNPVLTGGRTTTRLVRIKLKSLYEEEKIEEFASNT